MTTPASALIRASIEALPEHQRQPWEYRATSVYIDGRSRGSLVAVPHVGPSVATDVTGEAGQLIALLGPDVATALADLLDKVRALENAYSAFASGETDNDSSGWADTTEDAVLAADALEQAITKGQP